MRVPGQVSDNQAYHIPKIFTVVISPLWTRYDGNWARVCPGEDVRESDTYSAHQILGERVSQWVVTHKGRPPEEEMKRWRVAVQGVETPATSPYQLDLNVFYPLPDYVPDSLGKVLQVQCGYETWWSSKDGWGAVTSSVATFGLGATATEAHHSLETGVLDILWSYLDERLSDIREIKDVERVLRRLEPKIGIDVVPEDSFSTANIEVPVSVV